METTNCSYDIPENADSIVFAENFVNYFMSLYGFKLPSLRIPTEYRGIIYDAFNEMVKVTANFIFYRISVFNTYATFQKLGVVNKYTYLLFASNMEKRYFSKGFLLSHFLHYCCQLTYMAVSFYTKNVHEAPSFAVSCIIEKLADYNMLVCGGWRALNKAASRYVTFIRECGYLTLSDRDNIKPMLQEMESGRIKSGFLSLAKGNDDDSVQSYESGMTVSSDEDSFVEISLDDFGSLQTEVGNANSENRDGKFVGENEFNKGMPVEGKSSIDRTVPAVENREYFIDKDDSTQANKSKIMSTVRFQATTQTVSFINENLESKQSGEYKTLISNVISDESYLFDGCKRKVTGSLNFARKSDDSPNSNNSDTSIIVINSDDCLQDVASNANSVKKPDLSMGSSGPETSMVTMNSGEEGLLDGTTQNVVKNVNFIEEILDFVLFWKAEDIVNATYDWEEELFRMIYPPDLSNNSENRELKKNGDTLKTKLSTSKSRKTDLDKYLIK